MRDPTALEEIDFDPMSARMCGATLHGKMSFDVPFISQIEPNLLIGGCSFDLKLPSDIKHVISLYPWEAYECEYGQLESCLSYALLDELVAPNSDIITNIARWVNTCKRNGMTLVHCQAGLNRSALVVGMSLVLEGMRAFEAIALLREKRSPAVLCNSAFEAMLLAADNYG